jgi:hypothetical protein
MQSAEVATALRQEAALVGTLYSSSKRVMS